MTIEISATNSPDRVERLEKEHRVLIARLTRLEKKRNSWIGAFLGNTLLIVCAGLLADYLGFFPPKVNRLPFQAKKVEAEEFVLKSAEGMVLGRIVPKGKGFVFLDASEKPIFTYPQSEAIQAEPKK